MNQKHALQSALQGSSPDVLAMLLAKVLTRTGYGEVQLDRKQKAHQNQQGCELICHTTLGHVPLKVTIKIIYFSVTPRVLDEMAGTVDRTGSDFGIVVSTKGMHPKAVVLKDAYTKSRVEVMSGAFFASLLRKFSIGVRSDGSPDYAFFGEMENQCARVNEFLHGRFSGRS